MFEDAESYTDICELVDHCKAMKLGDDYIFRGMRIKWPLSSTLFRFEDEKQRSDIWDETLRFCQWIKDNPSLKPFIKDELLFAIAQHYYSQFFTFNLATDVIDFTRDVKIAAFFATTSDKITTGDEGVVYAVSKSEFEKYFEEVGKLSGTSTPGAFFEPDLPKVSGSWRLENQKGLFMKDYGGFVSRRHSIWGIIGTRFVFKQTAGVTITDYFPEINEQLIYPTLNNFERCLSISIITLISGMTVEHESCLRSSVLRGAITFR